MKLLSFNKDGILKLGVLGIDNSVIEFHKANINAKNMYDFIQNHTEDDLKRLRELSQKSNGLKQSQIDIIAPIQPLQDIICVGINYFDHSYESFNFKNQTFDGKRENAVYFSKRASVVIGNNEVINSHKDITSKLDYEVELALILAKDAKNVSKEQALEFVFGYTIFNDITARDLQSKHKQFYFAKSLDTSCVLGTFITTADEVDPHNLSIKSYVNNQLRQDSNTKFMIFDIAHIISELSAGMTLKAGTVIATGTPSGTGIGFNPPKFLQSGDHIKCQIQGLGTLENIVK